MNRSKPLKRSSGPARKGKSRKPSMAGFWKAVTNDGQGTCAVCGRWGLLDAHHFVPRRRLPESAQADPRNGVCLDRQCHEWVENARIVCPRPPLLDDFLADHGLLEFGRPDPRRKDMA